MTNIEELIPSTKGKPKPDRPADVVPNEEFEKKRKEIEAKRITENPDLTIADLYDLIQSKEITKDQLDSIDFITDNERSLLKITADLLWGLNKKDETIEELRKLIKQIKQRHGEE